MASQKWMPISGCSNYMVSNFGRVKRLRHRSNGKRHTILKEKIIELYINRQAVVYVNLIDDSGRSKIFGVQKLVLGTFGSPGTIYYKTTSDPFNNRMDQFVPSETYDRMTYKPTIYKTIRT